MDKLIANLLRIALPNRRAADAADSTIDDSSSSNAVRRPATPARRASVATPTASRYGVRTATHATIAGDSVLTSVGEYRKQRGELDSTPVKPAPVNPRGRN